MNHVPNDPALPEPPSDQTTLVEVIGGYRDHGFAGDFFVEPDATVRCGHCATASEARRMEMHSLRRLEGASDPADMAAVIATSCPVCGSDGTMVVAFGPMASKDDLAVQSALQDRRDSDELPRDASPSDQMDDQTEVV